MLKLLVNLDGILIVTLKRLIPQIESKLSFEQIAVGLALMRLAFSMKLAGRDEMEIVPEIALIAMEAQLEPFVCAALVKVGVAVAKMVEKEILKPGNNQLN